MTPSWHESSAQTPPAGEAQEFSRLWRAARPDDSPLLEKFLAQHPELPPEELAAVVRVDLRERRRRGEIVDSRTYLARFPALAGDPELAVDVIYAEYMVREEQGETLSLQDYVERFPEYAGLLADQLSLHDVFANPSGDAPHAAGADHEPAAESRSMPGLEANYEILEVLGRGGMGVVYKARQQALNRFVALKMVRRADLENDELLARFRAEAEVVASLHHPQIVQVYDYGEHEGAPYLALELIEGGSLAERLDGAPWNPRTAAALLEQIARAVHFAHERGVVHRDLKPNNLLIGSSDSEPLELKIADFGLAKVFRDDPASRTQTGALLGTPSYMAPEQAYGKSSAVGPAADVYALGAILYELLSGRPPYRGETAIDALQQLLLAEPVSIYRLVPGLPRDLATICSKCLERAPERRYGSALELAEDLRRYLADRPIHARPAGPWERGWRWCHRNSALAAALGSVALLLLTVSIVSTWYSSRLSQQLTITRRAEIAERGAHNESQLRLWNSYLAEVSARNSSRKLGQRFEAMQTIRRAKDLLGAIGASEERLLQLRGAMITSLALPDLQRASKLCDQTAIYSADVALDADRVVFNRSDRELLVRRTSDGALLARAEHDVPEGSLSLSPDGRRVSLSNQQQACVWTIGPRGLELAWQQPDLSAMMFTPDSKYALVCHAGTELLLIQAADGAVVHRLGDAASLADCAFHANSPRVAVSTARETRIFNWETGTLLATLPGKGVVRLAWHPGGRHLAAWADHNIRILEIATGKVVVEMPHAGYPQQLQFSADGGKLISCSLWDSHLLLWDVGTGQKELDVYGFANLAMDVSSAGPITLLRHDGTSVERWELADGSECRSLPRAWFPALGGWSLGSISPDGRLLALSGEKGLELWDLHEFRRVAQREDTLCAALFDRQGNIILARESGVYRWPRRERMRPGDAQPATSIVSFGPPQHLGDIDLPTGLATSRPKNTIVYGALDGWHATSLSHLGSDVVFQPEGDPRMAALSSDEQIAAVAGWESGSTTVWNVATATQLADLPTGKHGVLEFSPDGRWLASTPSGVRIWRTADWTLAHELHAQGTTPTGLGLGFSADSRVLAVGQSDGELCLFDPQRGACLARFTHPAPNLSTLIAFTPDNRTLVTLPLLEQTPGRVWDLVKIRHALRAFDLDWPADVLRAGPASSAPATPLEIEWSDDGWTLLKSAVRALQGAPPPASAE